jgi:phosphoribosylanthranilate isomerase
VTAIKMCGVTREEDARAAVALGVHALGFVLWPESPRYVPLDVAAGIIQGLPPFVVPVGVFVSPSSALVAEAVQAGIRLAQVHGDSPWPDGRGPAPMLRVVHLAPGRRDEIEPAVPLGRAVLLDTHDPTRHGGTGRTIDWARAARIAAMRPVVLAGGLTPENVGQAIETVRPYAVDVASGIEARPGVKDPALMRRFVDAVRQADLRPSSPRALRPSQDVKESW